MCSDHERITGGVSATKHKRLCFLVQATCRRDLLVAIGIGIQQAVVDGIVVREKFELFRIVSQIIDLIAEELYWSIMRPNE